MRTGATIVGVALVGALLLTAAARRTWTPDEAPSAIVPEARVWSDPPESPRLAAPR